MQFIFYTPVTAAFVCATAWPALPDLESEVILLDGRALNFFAMYLITAALGTFVFFFLLMHCALAAQNQTTVEFLHRRHVQDEKQYDLGCARNLEDRCGPCCLHWVIPLNLRC
eukprot:TRINITY_DN14767_c0_g1_i1.p2 TRINITY_DN14767_c0_g1~~TRINITY_DN14767_c0_g1_i1.p2  ORF type:complete len:113 (-),score=24.86 TRINITY_DN14767_c0_g1_i1:73-411(-)